MAMEQLEGPSHSLRSPIRYHLMESHKAMQYQHHLKAALDSCPDTFEVAAIPDPHFCNKKNVSSDF